MEFLSVRPYLRSFQTLLAEKFMYIPQVEAAAERAKRPGRRAQPTNLDGLMRRWLAVRLSEKAAGRVADQWATANVKSAGVENHLPLLGSAALLQLARSNADPQLVSIGANVRGP